MNCEQSVGRRYITQNPFLFNIVNSTPTSAVNIEVMTSDTGKRM